MYRIFFFLLASLLLFMGCKKDPLVPLQLRERYQLNSVIADKPLDLNFDGVKSINLKDEILALQGEKSLIIDTSMSLIFVDILWAEPQINNGPILLKALEEFDDASDIEYLTIRNPFYYKLENNTLSLLRRVVINHTLHYTFIPPQRISIEKDGEKLTFRAGQKYLTPEGIQSANLTIEYVEAKK